MLAVGSYHFELELVASLGGEGFSIDVPMNVTGDFQSPDRIQGDLSVSLGFISIESQIIAIGDSIYMTDVETGEWVAEEESPLFASPTDLIRIDPRTVKDLQLLGSETLDGIRVFHLKGIAPPETVTDAAEEFEIDFWIGAENSYLRQLEANLEIAISGDDPLLAGVPVGKPMLSIKLTFSDYGKQVAIEPPEIKSAPAAEATPAPPPTAVPLATPVVAPPPTAQPVAQEPAPADLMEKINAAMLALDGVHLVAEVFIKKSREADSSLIYVRLEGDRNGNGDTQIVAEMSVATEAFTGTFSFETREIAGTTYTNDPLSGTWAEETGGESFADASFVDALSGRLSLDNVTASEETLDGAALLRLQGTVIEDSSTLTVLLWADPEDLLIRRMEMHGPVSASELEGLVSSDAESLFQSALYTLTRHNESVLIEVPQVQVQVPEPAPETTTVRPFDAAGIEAAFGNAPDSFIRIDPGDTGASIESLGVGDFFTDIAVFARLDGFEFLYGLTGQLDGLAQIQADLAMVSPENFATELRQGIGTAGLGSPQVVESGPLDSPTVGDRSVSAFVVLEVQGVQMRQNVVQFRRGEILALVIYLYLVGTPPLVDVNEAAAWLDTEIQQALASQP